MFRPLAFTASRWAVGGTRALSATAGSSGSYLPPPRVKAPHLHTRDPHPVQAPKSLRVKEAENMGKLDLSTFEIRPRPVPVSPKEYAVNFRKYKQEVNEIRKQFKAEWDARRKRENDAALAERAKVEEQMRKRAEIKAVRRAANIAAHERNLAIIRERRDALKRVHRDKRLAMFAEVQKKRVAWLQTLNADAANWVDEDQIETKITPEVFQLQRPWQYDKYYAQKPVLPAGEVQFREDWDSDVDHVEVDIMEPLTHSLKTGVQLQELHDQKRMPEIIEDLKQWQENFMAKYPEIFTPDAVDAVRSGMSAEEFMGFEPGQQPVFELTPKNFPSFLEGADDEASGAADEEEYEEVEEDGAVEEDPELTKLRDDAEAQLDAVLAAIAKDDQDK